MSSISSFNSSYKNSNNPLLSQGNSRITRATTHLGSFKPSNPIKENEPISKRAPLPISNEFDNVVSQHKSTVECDRADWLERVLENNPEIKEFRECVNPISRASSFARLYLPPNRLVPHDLLLSLISQHCRTLGLSETQSALHGEWGSDFVIPPHKLYSQLGILAQRGIYRTEKFWELTIPSIHACSTPKLTQISLDEEISRTIGASTNQIEDLTPIEKEIPEDSNFFRTEEGSKEPVEASLNQIIFYVTDPNNENTHELLSALCLTISSYTSSSVFFTKIRDLIRIRMKEVENEIELEKKKKNKEKKNKNILKVYYKSRVFL